MQNSANHRIFERNLRPRLVRGHVCLSVHFAPSPDPPRGSRAELVVRSRLAPTFLREFEGRRRSAVGSNSSVALLRTGRCTGDSVPERTSFGRGGSAASVSLARLSKRNGLRARDAWGSLLLPDRKLRNGPQIRRDYPLSLSISLSGGKETNQDFLSSGERTGKSPA